MYLHKVTELPSIQVSGKGPVQFKKRLSTRKTEDPMAVGIVIPNQL